MDRDVDMYDPFHVDRLYPMYPDLHSVFDRSQRHSPVDHYMRNPNRGMGLRHHRGRDHFGSALQEMDERLRDMQRNLEAMHRHFNTYMPLSSELSKLENPIVKNRDGSTKMHLQFDVRHFTPEEINIKTKDGVLEIHAKHEDKTDHGSSYREYHRAYKIPDQVDRQAMKSELSPEGILTIEAVVQPAIEGTSNQPKNIAITHH